MRFILSMLSGVLVAAAGAQACHGAVKIVANEIGGNVEFKGSGTINLAGFTTFRDVFLNAGLYPINGPFPPGIVVGGNSSGSVSSDAYGGFSIGPSTFGNGKFRKADVVFGDRFGAGNWNLIREIYVPDRPC